MTRDEALSAFGVDMMPDKEILIQLYRTLQKAAALRGDGEATKRLNIARDVLMTGAQAEDVPAPAPALPLTGYMPATCREKKVEFILPWELINGHYAKPILHFEDPQRMTWRHRLTLNAKRLKRGGKNRRRTSHVCSEHKPFEFFRSQIEWPYLPCLICKAPRYDWCDDCGTVFCRPAYDRTLSFQSYRCPTCMKQYGWGERFPAKRPLVRKSKRFHFVENNDASSLLHNSVKLIERSK